jgi:hypothetical protein
MPLPRRPSDLTRSAPRLACSVARPISGIVAAVALVDGLNGVSSA